MMGTVVKYLVGERTILAKGGKECEILNGASEIKSEYRNHS